MPVPTAITQLSETASANSPGGSETVGTNANDYIQAAYAFIRQIFDGQMTPLAALNFNAQKVTNIANGVATTDAATVGQVNTVLGAPSGTRMVFQQAAAPTGWTVDASSYLQDCAMRFNAGASHGGTSAWSAWNFGGSQTTNGTALSVAQIPSHNHVDSGHNHAVNDPGHNHYLNDPGHSHSIPGNIAVQGSSYSQEGTNSRLFNIQGWNTNPSGTGIWLNASGTGIYLSAAAANISYTGSGGPHTHTYQSPQTKYADCVVCTKN